MKPPFEKFKILTLHNRMNPTEAMGFFAIIAEPQPGSIKQEREQQDFIEAAIRRAIEECEGKADALREGK